MPPPRAGTVPARLLSALQAVHHSQPRCIASPPSVPGAPATGASRRASVAIIIRLRPENTTTASSNGASSTAASPLNASPFTHTTGLAPSPPSSPPLSATVPPPPRPPSPSASTTSSSLPPQRSVEKELEEFFSQDWIQRDGTTAEVLFIKRATRATDKWSGHVAFPGGRQEADDEDGHFTAMRETWEEVGLDLAERDYLSIGALDDREITTSLGKRLLMVLSPYVFLSTSREAPVPELQESEVASCHWIPLELLHAPQARYGTVGIDISTRLAPRNVLGRLALKALVGSMQFKCILLPNEPIAVGQPPFALPPTPLPDLKLWGLTLGMTIDLLSTMSLPNAAVANASSTKSGDLSTYPHAAVALDPDAGATPFAPSNASIFPRFTYPDINFLIWLFGFRYRRLHKSASAPGSARVNWAGVSIGSYYAAVRRALVVAVVLRGTIALGALGWLSWWVKKRFVLDRRTRGRIGL